MEENITVQTTTFYVLLDEDDRIAMLTVNQQTEEQFAFEFPADFNVADIINWKIIDDALVYDVFDYPEEEPQMPLEERISDLEVAICELMDSLA